MKCIAGVALLGEGVMVAPNITMLHVVAHCQLILLAGALRLLQCGMFAVPQTLAMLAAPFLAHVCHSWGRASTGRSDCNNPERSNPEHKSRANHLAQAPFAAHCSQSALHAMSRRAITAGRCAQAAAAAAPVHLQTHRRHRAVLFDQRRASSQAGSRARRRRRHLWPHASCRCPTGRIGRNGAAKCGRQRDCRRRCAELRRLDQRGRGGGERQAQR